jgi:DNA-binding transcriptional regulator YiaG
MTHPLQDRRAFREARKTLGLSSAGLAAMLHMPDGAGRTVRRWESGDSPIPGPVATAVGLLMEARS